MKIHCIECGKSVSSELPDYSVFRAVATCPECIEKQPEEKSQTKENIKLAANWLSFVCLLAILLFAMSAFGAYISGDNVMGDSLSWVIAGWFCLGVISQITKGLVSL